jgi:hypothetical protein
MVLENPCFDPWFIELFLCFNPSTENEPQDPAPAAPIPGAEWSENLQLGAPHS